MPSNDLEKLSNAIMTGEDDEAEGLTRNLITEKTSVEEILKAMKAGLAEAGKKLETREYFVADLAMSGMAAKKTMDLIVPILEKEKIAFKGTCVIGSARSDVHDIGKNLVAAYLRGAGLRVIDLGVDVYPEKFVEATKKNNAQIMGVSCYNTSVADTQLSLLRDAFIDANYRDKVKLMVGGAGAYRDMILQYSFDGFGRDAYDAVMQAERLLKDLSEGV